MRLPADLDPLQVMLIEPDLEAIHVALGVGLPGLSALDRKVGVDPVRRRSRLAHDHCREGDARQGHSSREGEVHDRHSEAAGNPDPPQSPHERVQEERDQRGDEKEENNVTDRARHDPQADQHERQSDQLDPASDNHFRRPIGHVADGTAGATRPPPWEWSFAEDGALALDSHELWTDIEAPRRLFLLQAKVPGELKPRSSSASVRPMPRRAPAGRRTARRPQRRHHEHRVRRFAFLTVISIVLVVTLLLTAFGNAPQERAAFLAPAPAQRLLPAGRPQPLVIAKLEALRIQLPIEAGRVTAIGFHSAGDGTLALVPVGRQGNEGLFARLGHRLFGGGGSGPVWYQLNGGQGPETGGVDVGAAAGTNVYSPVDGTIVGLMPYVLNGRAYGYVSTSNRRARLRSSSR